MLIARNPYTRLLSAWLDKMRSRDYCVGGGESHMHTPDCQHMVLDDTKRAMKLYGNPGPVMSDTFGGFVE